MSPSVIFTLTFLGANLTVNLICDVNPGDPAGKAGDLASHLNAPPSSSAEGTKSNSEVA